MCDGCPPAGCGDGKDAGRTCGQCTRRDGAAEDKGSARRNRSDGRLIDAEHTDPAGAAVEPGPEVTRGVAHGPSPLFPA